MNKENSNRKWWMGPKKGRGYYILGIISGGCFAVVVCFQVDWPLFTRIVFTGLGVFAVAQNYYKLNQIKKGED